MYYKGINSQNAYYADTSKKNYDFTNKENMIPNKYSEYNMNNINPYLFNNRDKFKNNMNYDHYSTYQRHQMFNDPDTYNNENPFNYNPTIYNKSEFHPPPPNTNQDLYNRMNNDMNYEEYTMNNKKDFYRYHNEGTFRTFNENHNDSHFTEYNKTLKAFVKPITVRSEAEISFFEYLMRYITKKNTSWKLGNYLFNTSLNRYVSILIPDIQLQQWAVQILGNLVYFSLVDDKQNLIKQDLGNIIECLIKCLISIELFIKSPPILPTQKELPVELDIMISVLQSTIYKITLSYYNEIKQLKLSPRIHKKLQHFLEFKE